MGKQTEKLINTWTGYEFESSTIKTPEFRLFAREFKKALKELVAPDWTIHSYNAGHFYVSGFLKDKESGKYVYFSISDVRYFPDTWNDQVLIRTAKDDKDYTGGGNRYANLRNLKESLGSLK